MPIFEYKCNDCGHVTEFLESGSKTVKHKCAKCDSANMTKAWSTFAVGKNSTQQAQCDSCSSQNTCGSGGCPFS